MSKVSANLVTIRLHDKTAGLVSAKAPASIPIGIGIATAGLLGSKLGLDYLYRNADKPDTEEGVRLFNALRKKAKSEGIKVKTMPNPLDGTGSYYIPDADSITTGRRADLLAHEYGHSQYSGGRGGLVGRLAHKGYGLSRTFGTLNGLTMGIHAINGIFNPNSPIASTAVPAVASVPMLMAEGLASRKGYKTLKELGASDEYLKNTRRNLLGAWSTYAGAAGMNAGVGLMANGLGTYIRNVIKQ